MIANTNISKNLIKAIDSSSIHRICSGQVIVDLSGAVKELIENALDAKATTIEIRLKDMGLNQIEVTDNGQGIKPHDYDGIAMNHYTSKVNH